MKKSYIIREYIFKQTFGEETINEETIVGRINATLTRICGVPEEEISQYYQRSLERSTLYFKRNNSTTVPFLPIKAPEGKKPTRRNYEVKVGIPTIMNTYDNVDKDTFRSTLELIIFLLQANLTKQQRDVALGKLEDDNIEDRFSAYLQEIEEGSEHREDVLALMIDFLTNDQTTTALTIVTNDLNFSTSIVPAMLQFIHSKKELWLCFDPASAGDVLSLRLNTLWRLGLHIGVLPIKNRYPVFGVIPNWKPDSSDDRVPNIAKILQFKTFFFEKNTGRNYSSIIKYSSKIKEFIGKIDSFSQGVTIRGETVGLKQMNHKNVEFKKLDQQDYLDKLKESFNAYQSELPEDNIVYHNVEFSFEKIDIESIYRRERTVPLYKILQAYRFIKYFKDSADKIFDFDEENRQVAFQPYAIENTDTFFPINVPFIEWNATQKRYELCEGHSRLWVLYNVFNIRTIEAVVVRKIRAEFFEPSESKVGARRAKNLTDKEMGFNTKWNESDFKCERNDFSEEEHILESRYAEAITHRATPENFETGFNELVRMGILEKDDKVYSKNDEDLKRVNEQ